MKDNGKVQKGAVRSRCLVSEEVGCEEGGGDYEVGENSCKEP